MFIIWNDGEKWNVDDSLTFTDNGVVYSTTITVNNIMYVYACDSSSKFVIYYSSTGSKFVLKTVSSNVGPVATITINNQ